MENLITKSFHINRDLRTLRRFWNILEIVASCGFRELVSVYFPEHRHRKSSRKRKNMPDISALDRPARLRHMLEELGPTFVKLGQILSTRPDMIGNVYAEELKNLTEHVTPVDFSEIKKIIEAETGRKIEEIFSSFDETPLASASIGQVHKAVLRCNGQCVAVKVRRPGVTEIIKEDLEIMHFIASRLESGSNSAAKFRPVKIVEEFSHSLARELDYMVEAANLTRFAADSAKDVHIKTAQVFFDYTTSAMLTMEFISGDSAGKIQQNPALREKYDLEKIAEHGVNSLLHQIFIAGFFHADPHPGNILILPDNRLCFIDFGMMGRIAQRERRTFLKTLSCMLDNDIPGMVDHALKMTVRSHFNGNRLTLERDAADLVDANINLPLDRLSLAKILNDLLKMLDAHGLALRPELYMMFKSLMTIEHLGKDFYPDLKIVEMVKPFLATAKFKALDPRRFFRRFFNDLEDNTEILQNLPGTAGSILTQLEEGSFTLRIEHHRLNDIEETLYLTGERLSRALLLAALFLGSALMIVAKIPPVWEGIPLIGMGGFLISGILSIYALWYDHRQRIKFLRIRTAQKLEDEFRKKIF
ncbi:MAG: AarF/ABC1/UbiB kinase family protein [Lentisphaerae bacterium]|nr:AarF/ABC1/UbiB kinase family protein [Lentisphaerota bacterium]